MPVKITPNTLKASSASPSTINAFRAARASPAIRFRLNARITRTVATKHAMFTSSGTYSITPSLSKAASNHGHAIDEDGLAYSPGFTPKCPRAMFSASAM